MLCQRLYGRRVHAELLEEQKQPVLEELPPISEIDLKALIAENQALKEQLTARREEQQQTYVPKPLDLSEYKTRKIYIDTMLMDAGWIEGKNWINEVELRECQINLKWAMQIMYCMMIRIDRLR